MERRETRRARRERNLRKVVRGRVVEESEKRIKREARRQQVRTSLETAVMTQWKREVKVVEEERMMRKEKVGKRGARREARQKLKRRR